MEAGLLSLRWNNHNSAFFHKLKLLRERDLYSDVTVACDGRYYSVHKLILSTCSNYFEEIFEKTLGKHPVIVLKDITQRDFEFILDYMYIGEINVLQNELPSLIKSAECLQIKGLAIPDDTFPKKSTKRNNSEGIPQSNKKRQNSSSSSVDSIKQSKNSESYNEKTSSVSPEKRQDTIEPKDDHLNPEIQSVKLEKVEEEDIYEITDDFANTEIKSEIPDPSELSNAQNSMFVDVKPYFESNSSQHNNPLGSRNFNTQEQEKQRHPWGSEEATGAAVEDFEMPGSYFEAPLDSSQMDTQTGGALHSAVKSTANDLNDTVKGFMKSEGSLWKCSYFGCSYEVYLKSDLIKHVRRHLGFRPFVCSQCDYRAYESSTLYRHIRSVHGVVTEGPAFT